MPFGQSLPWLNGKSVRGSTPTTRSSFTLRYMPHCWPQKQQWVGTRRSGCTPVSSSEPATYANEGPKGSGDVASVCVPSGVEIVAVLLAEGALTEPRVGVRRRRRLPLAALDHDPAALTPPQLPLRQREQRTPARRADPLVVADRGIGALVGEAELSLDRDQVLGVHARRERRAAAPAERRLLGSADRLVEPHTDLCRALEHVEELSERQPEERRDHADRVQDGDELEGIAAQPGVARRQHQTGEAHREEQDQRQEVLAEELQRGGALLAHAPSHGEHHPGDDEEGRPHETVKGQERDPRVDGEGEGREPEHERPVAPEIARDALEVEPAEDERERDGHRDETAPHDEQMRHAAEPAAGEDEPVGHEVARQVAHPIDGVTAAPSSSQERLPAAAPQHRRRRALQPHGVAVREPEGSEQDGGGVSRESGVEVCEAAGAAPNERTEPERRTNPPCDRPGDDAIHEETFLARDGGDRNPLAEGVRSARRRPLQWPQLRWMSWPFASGFWSATRWCFSSEHAYTTR